ncbi:hypothetical protein FNV43_RR15294 [Rhamnella rubrinervis]|uniref:Uncharacterized protein n=1 Tax=Rhamnella rubrinervis TaxID=2594499 RepID=A0A8K0E1K3_9ROSA|nr:hypothetical protein FNV43_RR15294 [Rhamnella rubrinervis]
MLLLQQSWTLEIGVMSTRILEMHLTRSRTHSFASEEKLQNPTGGSDNKVGCICRYLQNSKCTGSVMHLPELPLIDLQALYHFLLGFGAVLGQHLVGYYVRKLSFDDALNSKEYKPLSSPDSSCCCSGFGVSISNFFVL